MPDKVILENFGILESVHDCYKNHKMCNRAVDNDPHTLKFNPNCYVTQKMSDKAVNTHHSTIKLECYKTHELFDKAVNRCFFCI